MGRSWQFLAVVVAATTVTLGMQGPAGAASPTTTRVSVSPTEEQTSSISDQAAISANGRYVAFVSNAKELGIGFTRYAQVWLRDRQTGDTRLISRNHAGFVANNYSYDPSISADGRYVAFTSYGSNLVQGPAQDTNGVADVFIQDTWSSPPFNRKVSGFSTRLQGNDHSTQPSVSGDGRFIAFFSYASNLVPNDTNQIADVFVRDMQAGTIRRVSVSSAGLAASGPTVVEATPSISADGRFVAFASFASDLVLGDNNNGTDIFVRDRTTNTTSLVSVSSAGTQTGGDAATGAPSISAGGRFVAFHSTAPDLVTGDTNGRTDVFVRDRQAGTTSRVSLSSAGAEGSGDSFGPAVSADGRYVAFSTLAADLVPGDTNDSHDVVVRDRLNASTAQVSVSSTWAKGNSESSDAAISANGRQIAFESRASNLVPGDTNGWTDVFVRERW